MLCGLSESLQTFQVVILFFMNLILSQKREANRMFFFSSVLKCEMKFGIYLPETTDSNKKLPVLFYLSGIFLHFSLISCDFINVNYAGLTCTEANFIDKSGFQRFASQYQMIVVNPDTSPRGVDLPGCQKLSRIRE